MKFRLHDKEELPTFEPAARRWHDLQEGRRAPVHADDVITSLERDVFPMIGGKAVTAIDAPLVLKMLRAVEDRGSTETARRLRQRISGVYALLISEGVPPPGGRAADRDRLPGRARRTADQPPRGARRGRR